MSMIWNNQTVNQKSLSFADLDKEAYRLEFLIDKTNEHLEREMKVSIEAGEIVGEIYEGLLKQYINPESPESLHAINQLVVRLVGSVCMLKMQGYLAIE